MSEHARNLIRAQRCNNDHPCRCKFDGPLMLSSGCCVHGEKECEPPDDFTRRLLQNYLDEYEMGL